MTTKANKLKDTKFHTKTIIATRKIDGDTIHLVECSPKSSLDGTSTRARTFYEERDAAGKVLAFDGGAVILGRWKANGWA